MTTGLASATVRTAVAAVLAVALVVSDPVVAVADDRGEEPLPEDASWRDVARQMFTAAREQTFEGRLVVVSFETKPSIGEVTVVRDSDRTMMSGGPSTWVLGFQERETVLGDFGTGRLLRVGAERQPMFSIVRLTRNYDVTVAGEQPAVVGPALVLEFRSRDGGYVRERVHVDRATGLVVRRETYAADGSPIRLAAFTALNLGAVTSTDVGSDWETHEVSPMATTVSGRGIEILRDVGWTVPSELPGGFGLVDAFAVGEDERSSLHLLYTDGLYALSVYQQRGMLDRSAMVARGAEPADLGEMDALRWPRTEPATYLWSGETMTFTAVSDAPGDALAKAFSAFPAAQSPSLFERVRRRIARIVNTVLPG